MEIEVGEYGRTNKGKIFIFAWVENANYILVKTRNEENPNSILNFDKYYLDKDEEIVKHSKNIIDLIYVGDYVNGHLVFDKYIDTDDNGKEFIIIFIECDRSIYKSIEANDIKSIVTKEQFANIEYKIEKVEGKQC